MPTLAEEAAPLIGGMGGTTPPGKHAPFARIDAGVGGAFMRIRFGIVALGAAIAMPAMAQAAPLLWSTNGHYYEFVADAATWTAAKTDAESRSYLGLQGYLATETSADERAFIRALSSAYSWLGGYYDGGDALWKWTGGPEAGQAFYSPSGGSLGFTAWNPSEPNGNAGEPALAENACGACNWNDLSPSSALGYFVEYGGGPTGVVPEPASWALMLGGFGLIGGMLRRRRTTIAFG